MTETSKHRIPTTPARRPSRITPRIAAYIAGATVLIAGGLSYVAGNAEAPAPAPAATTATSASIESSGGALATPPSIPVQGGSVAATPAPTGGDATPVLTR